jgi:hypothetical protein
MYGLGETILESDPKKLLTELHATAIAINQAMARNDVASVRAMRAHFQDVANRYTSLGAAADASEFSWLDNFLLSTGSWVERSLAALPGAISALPQAIGEGLLKAAVPFALLAVGFIVLKNKALRR